MRLPSRSQCRLETGSTLQLSPHAAFGVQHDVEPKREGEFLHDRVLQEGCGQRLHHLFVALRGYPILPVGGLRRSRDGVRPPRGLQDPARSAEVAQRRLRPARGAPPALQRGQQLEVHAELLLRRQPEARPEELHERPLVHGFQVALPSKCASEGARARRRRAGDQERGAEGVGQEAHRARALRALQAPVGAGARLQHGRSQRGQGRARRIGGVQRHGVDVEFYRRVGGQREVLELAGKQDALHR
mmetsp:Transcript_86824/g.221182  ORF Transcript_86824/g.221182 Transcript_86824/m.221182 type:complete len:245 (-) Transcript_86824:778-1512(-)